MCGIVGAIAQRTVAEILIEGLKRLEYRGYDSAGVAILNHQSAIQRIRRQGKVEELAHVVTAETVPGYCGIAHTRWATHGEPAEHNAHPHMSSDEGVAVVHNGIIENHLQIRQSLQEKGYQFSSDTDSEIIAHLIAHYAKDQDIFTAVRSTISELKGAFALGIIQRQAPEQLIAVRHGSPLVIGLGIGESFIASDELALTSFAQNVIYLEEGDIAIVERQKVHVFNQQGESVTRKIHKMSAEKQVADKGKFRHFMQKEIFEQPEVLADTIAGRVSQSRVLAETFGEQAPTLFQQVSAIQIVACGTSYHAGLIAKYWFEGLAGIPCQVEVASEFRYRKQVIQPNTLFISISQSGETADTLAALRLAKEKDYLASLSICNVPTSSLVRESDLVFMTRAGVEIGVASTKAFTTQLAALAMLTCAIGQYHQLSDQQHQEFVQALEELAEQSKQLLQLDQTIKKLATQFADKDHALFLGRGIQYPVALEGALKLKEISYIHAEAYPAGELKHGPLALIDKSMPVVAIAPNDELLEKLQSNLQEVRARGGELYVFVDDRIDLPTDPQIHIIKLPATSILLAPILHTIPLQLLAYHVAVIRGTDVDQPRNLAKSVTVE